MPTAQTPNSLRAFFPIPCVIVSSWHWEGLWPTNDHGVSEDVKILHEMGYAQELSRRMGAFQNFAISFAIICVVAGGLTAFPAALSAGGGAANRRHVGGRQHLRAGRGGGHGPGCPVLPDRRRDLSLASIFGGRGFGWAAAWFNLRSSSPSCSSCCMTSGSTGPRSARRSSGVRRRSPLPRRRCRQRADDAAIRLRRTRRRGDGRGARHPHGRRPRRTTPS